MSSSSALFAHSVAIASGGTAQQVLSGGTGPGTSPDQPTSPQSSVVKARKGNTSPLYLGSATTGGGTGGSSLSATTGFELQAGDSIVLGLLGIGNLWVFGATTGDRLDILEV